MATVSIQDAVWQAAESLMVQGIRPTVANVREITQRGSAGTINDALKGWWQDLAERIRVRSVHPGIPEPVAAGMQQLWQLALTHGEAAFAQHRADADAQVEQAQQLRIKALERQQHAENLASQLEARLEALQTAERQLQTALAAESALRAQSEQQREALEASSQQALADVEHRRNQLEKELALLTARHRQDMQQADERLRRLEQELLDQRQLGERQRGEWADSLRALETRAVDAEQQLAQAQTETRLLREQLLQRQRDHADLAAQRPASKREQVRARLRRY